MARFIPIEKMLKLREAARSGDERAKLILNAQLNGEDFDLDGYFAPKNDENPTIMESKATEPVQNDETPFQMYLRENEITLDDNNRDEVIAEFESMTGRKAEFKEPVVVEEKNELDMTELIDDEAEALSGYSDYMNKLLASDLCEEKKALVKEKINKIIADEQQHIDILKGLECVINEKAENNIEEKEIIE